MLEIVHEKVGPLKVIECGRKWKAHRKYICLTMRRRGLVEYLFTTNIQEGALELQQPRATNTPTTNTESKAREARAMHP